MAILEEVIERFNKIHNYKYDYSNTVFRITTDKAIFTCREHGNWAATVKDHLKGSGCPCCAQIKRTKKQIFPFTEFVEEAKKKFGNMFFYHEDTYISKRKKTKITCIKHNITFFQTPHNHLSGIGKGCPKCRRENIINKLKENNLKFTTAQIIEESKKVWGKDRWDYSKFIYKGKHLKSTFICNKCETEFKQRVFIHLDKANGCPTCQTKHGWKRTSWIKYCKSIDCKYPLVYIMNCKNEKEEFIKIGFSSKIKRRLRNIPYETSLINSIIGKPGAVYDLEHKLHRIFKQYKYQPEISFKGETECFSTEILNEPNFQMFLQN